MMMMMTMKRMMINMIMIMIKPELRPDIPILLLLVKVHRQSGRFERR